MESPFEDKFEDRIKGMLEGHALADALGAPYEFFNNRLINYDGKLTNPPEVKSRWQGNRQGTVGQTTDDTMMTIALAKVIAKHGKYDRDAAILAYEKFANSTSMTGKNTRKLFTGVTTIKGYENRYASAKLPPVTNENVYKTLDDCQSNGSLMRASPLAILKLSDTDILEDCKLTNPSYVNQDCTVMYALILKYLICGNEPKVVYDYIIQCAQSEEVKSVVNDVHSDKRRWVNDNSNKGWVLHAFYCVMYVLKKLIQMEKSESLYREIVDEIICWGGDTDTNGAIVGAIVGAYLGHNLMIKDEKTKSNLEIMMNAKYTGPLAPKCDDFHPREITNLSPVLARIFLENHKV